jgi:hypothetical protein
MQMDEPRQENILGRVKEKVGGHESTSKGIISYSKFVQVQIALLSCK